MSSVSDSVTETNNFEVFTADLVASLHWYVLRRCRCRPNYKHRPLYDFTARRYSVALYIPLSVCLYVRPSVCHSHGVSC